MDQMRNLCIRKTMIVVISSYMKQACPDSPDKFIIST